MREIRFDKGGFSKINVKKLLIFQHNYLIIRKLFVYLCLETRPERPRIFESLSKKKSGSPSFILADRGGPEPEPRRLVWFRRAGVRPELHEVRTVRGKDNEIFQHCKRARCISCNLNRCKFLGCLQINRVVRRGPRKENPPGYYPGLRNSRKFQHCKEHRQGGGQAVPLLG